MLQQDPDTTSAAASAAASFARTLSAQTLLAATSRLQVTLHAGGSLETLFAVEQAFATACDDGASAREVICAKTPAGAAPGALKLAAFDLAGRMLLERSFAAEPQAAPPEQQAEPVAQRHIFLITAGPEADVLIRVLAAFAVQRADLTDVTLSQTQDHAAIRVETTGVAADRADLLVQKLRALPCVRTVGLGWRQAA